MEEESGYDSVAVAGAALATILFPLIALIVALLLLGGQTDLGKRSQLRTWAWVSGVLFALEAVVLLVLALVTL